MLSSIIRQAAKRHPSLERAIRRLIACVPRSRRLGRDFWEWYAFYQESHYWPPARLSEFQIELLRHLLGALKTCSAFYKQRLDGVSVDAIESLDDFQSQVPLLTRDEFRRSYSEIRATDWRSRRLEAAATSGTTGHALRFHHARTDGRRELAAVYALWHQVGYIPGRSRRAEFRGLTDPGKLVKHYPDDGMIRCSILHLEREHVRHYAEQIRRHGSDFFHGYPSALYLLARQIARSGLKFPQPKAMFFHSEEVYDWQADLIQEVFPSTKLMAVYGCAERTVLGAWCKQKRHYHMLPQYAIFEVDAPTRQIIGTNLFNTVNGFVRYAMTDTALEWSDEPCSSCRTSCAPVVAQLGGRCGDYLYSIEHGWLAPGIITYPFKALSGVQEVQLYQQRPEEVVVRYTRCAGAPDEVLQQELARLREELGRLVGRRTRCRFERVTSFARSSSGKFKWIICDLPDSRQGVNPTVAA